MLAFLRRQRLKEHLKLMYQLRAAVDGLLPLDVEEARIASPIVEDIESRWKPGALLSQGDEELALDTWKMLRDFHETLRKRLSRSMGRPPFGPFDTFYVPLCGWGDYFDQHLPK